jgi:2-phospho-L-lactate guanylyltransferase (CobY/MobA/RfbA family)
MAERTGVPLRALIEWEGVPYVRRVLDAVRGCRRIGRIAVIGPPEIEGVVQGADLVLRERDTIVENLFGALEELAPQGRVLVTASDNPLLTSAAFDDFLARIPSEAAIAVPVLLQKDFRARFAGADNVGVVLRDGAWIGGVAVALHAPAIPRIRKAVERVLASRKSYLRMLLLLGPLFALRMALRLATFAEVQARASAIAGVPVSFVDGCNPVFPIDIDEPEDLDYLSDWARRRLS